MPSCCGTPGDHIREHKSALHFACSRLRGKYISILPNTIPSQHVAYTGNPFDVSSMLCRTAQVLKGLFQSTHTLQQRNHTSSLPWELQELRKWVLGLPFNAVIINIWRYISFHTQCGKKFQTL